jgi:DNA-binding beta-propeller fold protein YncE
MRTLSMLWILGIAAGAALAQDSRSVVLAASRAGRVEILDANSLRVLASLAVNGQTESVSASPDGRTLYVAQESEAARAGCCGLFSLDLSTRQMCLLIAPALFGAPSQDGRYLFTQRGNDSVDVFDAKLLARLPSIKAPGAYSLYPSPDGRWLLGVTNTPAPSVDVFDVGRGALARRIPLPSGPAMGAWAGDRFYVYSHDEGDGKLWRVNPESTTLPAAKAVHLPDLHGDCTQGVLLMMAGAPNRLFIAEAFGFKLDRRRVCTQEARGGIYVIDAYSGGVQDYINEAVYVNRMAVAHDGRELYVMDSSGPDEEGIRLLRIDSNTGRVLASRESQPGVWNLALANIPSALIPRGRGRASMPIGSGACQR